MYSTPVYLYQQINRVLLIDTSGVGAVFQRRWDPVYAKNLTLNKGVDNVLLFEFVNQDQKPVNITGSDFRFRIINTAGSDLVLEKSMTIISPVVGRVKVTIQAEESLLLPSDPCSYSIERLSGNLGQAVFVDDQAGGRGTINIVDSVFPEFVPSENVTIPDIYGPQEYSYYNSNQGLPDWALPRTYPYSGLDIERYSSHVPTNGQSLTTFRLSMLHFTGNIKAQAAQTYQSEWYDVGPLYQYQNQNDPVLINVEGYYPLIRLAVNQFNGNINSQIATASAVVSNGSVTSINVTNSGSGYVAIPNVTIAGYGAGAVAEAEIVDGSVSAINVINGGSGYIVDPTNNIAALVSVNTGFITDIVYR
jgi:hypothetical protein